MFGDFRSRARRRRRAKDNQNVRSPKLRSPKELSPGIPRRPTAPREPGSNAPDAGSSRCGTGTPRATANQQRPCSRVNTSLEAPRHSRVNTPLQAPHHSRVDTPLQAPHHPQLAHVQRRHDAVDKSTANRRRVNASSEKFAQSQLQVSSI